MCSHSSQPFRSCFAISACFLYRSVLGLGLTFVNMKEFDNCVGMFSWHASERGRVLRGGLQARSHDMSEPYLPPEDVGKGGAKVGNEGKPGDFFMRVGKLFVAGTAIVKYYQLLCCFIPRSIQSANPRRPPQPPDFIVFLSVAAIAVDYQSLSRSSACGARYSSNGARYSSKKLLLISTNGVDLIFAAGPGSEPKGLHSVLSRHEKMRVSHVRKKSARCQSDQRGLFYKKKSRTSAVSSTNFRSILIFASCVVGTCNILRTIYVTI